MAGTITNEFGTIRYSEDLLSRIAGIAAMENYGIAGMKAKKTADTLIQLVGGESQKCGVVVTPLEDDESAVDIDLYAKLVYGVTLPTVARNTIENVRYRVQEMTGIRVRYVNIHVEGICVPED